MQVFPRLDIDEGYHEMELPASTTNSQNRVRRAGVGVHEPSIDTSQVLAAACLASAVNLEWTLVRDICIPNHIGPSVNDPYRCFNWTCPEA